MNNNMAPGNSPDAEDAQEQSNNWAQLVESIRAGDANAMQELYQAFVTRMLQGGLNIRPVITHRFSYRDFQKGFEVMLSGQSGKVILDWKDR